jgi:membrane associated rhomboid family serine protease
MNLNLSDVVRNLLLINIVVYVVATFILPADIRHQWFAVYYPGSDNFKPAQLITYMFMHDTRSLNHLFFNMLGLVMFGPAVEYSWGPKQFLFYYLAAGFGALALHFGVQCYQINFMDYPPEIGDIPMVGASGAIFGVLIAYGIMFPNNEIRLLFPPVPIRAIYLVLGYTSIELYAGIMGSQPGVAHFAHLGGALFGFLLIMYWRNGGTVGK